LISCLYHLSTAALDRDGLGEFRCRPLKSDPTIAHLDERRFQLRQASTGFFSAQLLTSERRVQLRKTSIGFFSLQLLLRVPPGMWLEFARRDLQPREAV
jgi:hypothetical protein